MVFFRFVNMQWKDKQATVFVENPIGDELSQDFEALARRLFNVTSAKVAISNDFVTVT